MTPPMTRELPQAAIDAGWKAWHSKIPNGSPMVAAYEAIREHDPYVVGLRAALEHARNVLLDEDRSTAGIDAALKAGPAS